MTKLDSCPCKGKKFNYGKYNSKWLSCIGFTNGVTISDRDKVSVCSHNSFVLDRLKFSIGISSASETRSESILGTC